MSFHDWPDPSGAGGALPTSSGTLASAGQLTLTSALGSTTVGGGPGGGGAWPGGGASTRNTAGSPTAGSSANTLTGGASTGGASTGGASTGGTTSSADTGGSTSAVAGGFAGATNTLSTKGGTSSTSHEQIRWLAFTGARADGSEPVNASLGISGLVRLESDTCADASFDPVSRCVSGRLCAFDYEIQSWGVALAFDFVAIDNQRFRWDPRAYAAIGVAYRLSGAQIPLLQLWVLDMDTAAWPNSCSGSPCEIVGPPFGDDRIGNAGTLRFDSMIRDDWSGSGVAYQHQAENTLSLQFKLPAVRVGDTAFEFCLDQLGILVESL